MKNNPSEFDETLFRTLFTNADAEKFQDFCKIFHDSWTLNASKLDEAISKLDFIQIKLISHNLKGSAANLGANRMKEICGTLGEYADLRKIEPIPELAFLLREECKKAENSLEDFGKRLPDSASN